MVKLFAAAIIAASMLIACGSGGGGGSDDGVQSGSSTPNVPAISNLSYSPDSALLNSGSGAFLINMTFDFSDLDGDMSTITVTYFDSQNTELASFSSDIQGASGYISGQIKASIYGDTTETGIVTFQIYVTDASGNKSNALSGTYNISMTPIQDGTSTSDQAHGIATDASGNIFLTGFSYGNLHGNTNAGGPDAFLLKYDSSLTRQWTRLLGSASMEVSNAVASDTNGNVFITGYTEGDLDGNSSYGYHDIFISKYNSSGTKQWTRLFGGANSWDSEMGYDVAVDANGNAYIVGFTSADLDGYKNQGYNDAFLIKYDSSGVRQWTELIGSSQKEYAEGVAVDSSGNIYVAGYTGGGLDGNTNAGSFDVFLVKYDSSGTSQWTKQIGTDKEDVARAVAVDSSGNIYVTGYSKGSLAVNNYNNYSGLFLVKYNPQGVMQWSTQRRVNSFDGGRAWDVEVDASGHVYVIGTEYKTTLCIKYDSNGTVLWVEDITTDTTYENGLAIDAAGKVYITGYTNGSFEGTTHLGGADYFLLKYNSNGMLE